LHTKFQDISDFKRYHPLKQTTFTLLINLILKNFSLILNLVLLAAVAFLYYKIFTKETTSQVPVISGSGMSSEAIVFINSDSLLDNYNYFNSMKDILEKKQDSIDVMLKSRAQSLESEVMNYQNKAAGMSPDQRMQEEERLMTKQQGLIELKEKLIGELQERESGMDDSIHANLSRFLREYNKQKNYLYILGYQRGSGILFAHDSLDITRDVLEGLNKQ